MPRPDGGQGDLYVELDLKPLDVKDRRVNKIIEELSTYEGEPTPRRRGS